MGELQQLQPICHQVNNLSNMLGYAIYGSCTPIETSGNLSGSLGFHARTAQRGQGRVRKNSQEAEGPRRSGRIKAESNSQNQ